jgi:hypothetical protein
MPASKEDRFRVLQRRKRVADLYLRGVPQHEIAAREGVDPAQITRDLAAIRKEWRAQAVEALATRKARELARIDTIEAEAWAGWERSQQPAETMHAATEKGRTDRDGQPLPDRQKTWKTVKAQAGDPRFLERVAWCVSQRCRLLGLYGDGAGPPPAGGVHGPQLNLFDTAREIAARIHAELGPPELAGGDLQADGGREPLAAPPADPEAAPHWADPDDAGSEDWR